MKRNKTIIREVEQDSRERHAKSVALCNERFYRLTFEYEVKPK